jgi:hypothetical protein
MAINSRRVRLIDNPRLVQQLVGLERRTARSGKDSIDHSPGGKDDIANCVAGLCAAALGQYGSYDYGYAAWSCDPQVNGDLPQQSAPPPPEPPQANGNWWRSMPQSQPTYSADERLRGGYQSVDFAIKSGFFR